MCSSEDILCSCFIYQKQVSCKLKVNFDSDFSSQIHRDYQMLNMQYTYFQYNLINSLKILYNVFHHSHTHTHSFLPLTLPPPSLTPTNVLHIYTYIHKKSFALASPCCGRHRGTGCVQCWWGWPGSLKMEDPHNVLLPEHYGCSFYCQHC